MPLVETSPNSSIAVSGIVVPLLIADEEVITTKSFPVFSPSTGEQIWKCSSASVEDVSRIVGSSAASFESWSQTRPRERRDIFLRASAILQRRKDELSDYMIAETGASQFWARDFNVVLAAEMLTDIAGKISTITGEVPTCADENTAALVVREPYGVVLGIAPWNAPYILGFRACAAAIAAGNTVILKGSELSPRCAWAIGSVFKEAGLPSGVLNVITHCREDAAEVTRALIEHPDVQKINFTGSTVVGRVIGEIAGRNLKPVLLELGGKASAIVMKDANVEAAAEACALGAFLHAGQICMSTERIAVHGSILEGFVEQLKKAVAKLFDPVTSNTPLINTASSEKVARLVDDAVSHGAISVMETASGNLHPDTISTQYPITILQNTPKTADLYYQESFGPVVSVLPFETEEEALAIANDTQYGLSSAVFTENLQVGLRMARRIQSGAVHLNGMTVHDEPALPHGGVKASGFGRFGGSHLFDEFLRFKTITFRT